MNSLFIWREINHFQSHSHNDFPVTLLLFDVSPGDEACNLQASSALRSAKHEGVVAPPQPSYPGLTAWSMVSKVLPFGFV